MIQEKLESKEKSYEPGDYRLGVSLELARKSISENFPNISLKSIDYFSEGLGNVVFLVNGEYIFKFARHEKASKRLEQELNLLPKLVERISLPIPNPEYAGRQADNGLRFFGYKKIEGIGLTKESINGLDEETQMKLAKQLAELLKQISSIDLDEARQWGIEEVDPRTFYARQLKEAREIVYPILEAQYPEEAEELKTYIEGFFRDYFNNADNFDFKPAVVHGDLEGRLAIIFDPEKREISGIVDAGNPEINDPDFDLWRLYAHYGWDFMVKLLKFLPHDSLERLRGKLDFFWRAQTVHRAVRAILLKDEESIEISLKQMKDKAKDYEPA
ncbi:MAG: aminoglycoside 2''''-O-phosphotransferase [Candidatus Jorgensenbacteria bacterium GW2011_GWA1_48_11]|uniref:Aminoglycoside 2''''-O-phosphotransferase n=1 Tax=Candidatus Jorgensenbacteria bacterium GW2011_GWA1_48_11 TaxID=1618660 RepID=A0A0G1WLT1_9BACT|nr:MAG: aminoglycoside 2''''-O-phosphotransferase [Candidatus Jorgensenbacteria bacterium GW2011_GWA1_48_11]KKW12731.1 MAG: aminoglycoside 2''''-O-phosphotransferase [Candidatus Jorgensenbacteria bacterium GW2011_GWB1_49_9]